MMHNSQVWRAANAAEASCETVRHTSTPSCGEANEAGARRACRWMTLKPAWLTAKKATRSHQVGSVATSAAYLRGAANE